MNWSISDPFGDLLTTWRTRCNLTQTALAAALGTHRNTIGRWERGEVLPEARGMVLELARLLRLDEQETRSLLEASLTAQVPHWTVPFRRNPSFTGRVTLLELLHTWLATTQPVALIQTSALSGLGGIGKTQLAVEYAYRYALEYRAVFWLAAETMESLMASVQQIATQLQLPEHQATNQLQMVATVRRWLTTRANWLVIADNVEDLNLLQSVLPASRQGALLLTTRHLETQSLSIHRLVQAVLQDQMEPAEVHLWRARVICAINAAFPEPDFSMWPQCERYITQALTCVPWLEQVGGELPGAGELLFKTGSYLVVRGRYAEAQRVLEQALVLGKQVYGTDHPALLPLLEKQGELFWSQGKYVSARQRWQQALVLGERHLEPTHPQVTELLSI